MPQDVENTIYTLATHHGCDHETAQQIVSMLMDDWCGMRELWIERVGDYSGWCVRVPDCLEKYLNLKRLKIIIEGRQRSCDPFDPDTIRVKAWIEAARAGGEYVTEEIATGKIVDRYTLPGSKHGAAPLN